MHGLKRLMYAFKSAKGSSFPAEYKKVIGFRFDAKTYYEITGFLLRGSDTVRLSFSFTKACNVFGCYTDASAQTNYSLYVSTTTSAKYLRYNGGTYRSGFSSEDIGERFDVTITPTGSHGMRYDDTWDEQSFESVSDMLIGSTSVGASSSKFDGDMFGNVVVYGRLNCVPCERVSDGVLGYYDTVSGTFYEPVGDAPTSLGYL